MSVSLEERVNSNIFHLKYKSKSIILNLLSRMSQVGQRNNKTVRYRKLFEHLSL